MPVVDHLYNEYMKRRQLYYDDGVKIVEIDKEEEERMIKAERQKKMEDLFFETFQIPFSELKPMHPPHIVTKDGTTHFIHTKTNAHYGYMHIFDIWIRV